VTVWTWLKPTLSALRISEPVTSNRLIWAMPLFVVIPDVEGVASFCVVVVAAGEVLVAELAAAAGAAAVAARVELSGVAG
jgi:hypothetical protein